jgi:hypothetical protein
MDPDQLISVNGKMMPYSQVTEDMTSDMVSREMVFLLIVMELTQPCRCIIFFVSQTADEYSVSSSFRSASFDIPHVLKHRSDFHRLIGTSTQDSTSRISYSSFSPDPLSLAFFPLSTSLALSLSHFNISFLLIQNLLFVPNNTTSFSILSQRMIPETSKVEEEEGTIIDSLTGICGGKTSQKLPMMKKPKNQLSSKLSF